PWPSSPGIAPPTASPPPRSSLASPIPTGGSTCTRPVRRSRSRPDRPTPGTHRSWTARWRCSAPLPGGPSKRPRLTEFTVAAGKYPVNAGGVRGLEPRGRILTLMALVLSAYLVLLGRLVYWQVWRHGDMAQLAAAYHDDTITLPAVRGNILDRNGSLLVTNTPVFSIFASPDLISATERQDIAAR